MEKTTHITAEPQKLMYMYTESQSQMPYLTGHMILNQEHVRQSGLTNPMTLTITLQGLTQTKGLSKEK
jgi:hypothetical protein